MTVYKVGVIADTHVPEFLPELPTGVAQVFADVDLIVHTGDITGQEVLEQLGKLAPVKAVKGDHDKLDLPLLLVIEIGGVRIGAWHGRRPRWQEFPSLLFNTFSSRYHSWGGFQRQAVRRFRQVDVIVFGHFHRPYIGWQRDVLLFNPGAVYHPTHENVQSRLAITRYPWQRLYLRRALLRPAGVPTVGILTIEDGKVHAEVVPLPAVL
jgi:putative phosphoesterase